MVIVEGMVGAALGVTLQILLDAIKRAKDRSSATRCILDRLDATVFRISPLVDHVDKLMSQEVENSHKKIIEDLKLLLEKAVSLVEVYAELRHRDLIKKYRYKRRIKELEASIKWMIDVDVKISQWADIKELMPKMSEMNTKLDEITRKPIDSSCFRTNHGMSQGTIHNVVEAIDQSSKGNDESPTDGSKPKIDIHLRWISRKRTKDHEIRFTFK